MGNDEYTLKEYQIGFNEFNKFINIINKISSNYYEGYFVEKRKYDEFKKQYEVLLMKEQEQFRGIDLRILEKYKMNTENVESLKINLLNNKEYIFINKGLYQLICKKNDEEQMKNLVNLYSDIIDIIICDIKDNKPILRLKKNRTTIFNRSSLYLSPTDNYDINNNINNSNNGEIINF